MTTLDRIAYFQNRRDEVPNQQLARELVATRDREGIREIADNLNHQNPSVQSDCLKVLYEIGYLAPDLIADYVDQFLALLRHKNNRMVWGGMIALATLAELKAAEIWNDVDAVIDAVNASRKDEYLAVLESRKPEMTPSQLVRLQKVTRQIGAG